TKRMWPWGDSFEAGRANLGSERTTAVGANGNGASAYGVQDMAGNVMEWVDAFYQPYSGNGVADPNFGNANRIVRGGHFRSSDQDARTTRRFYNPPKFTAAELKAHTWLIGFRCVVPANDPKLQAHLRSEK
ncbi:MAG TPA: SUMF1/EgtB/PvdO family nonheme iron enzyme, partial [Pyrinomonadaceae bacterium]|nr:SUMF1/EgtB/PvdO family nonheme iron enzyme [Pyrinomonadaceae bacterium]